jgi:copper transport protein
MFRILRPAPLLAAGLIAAIFGAAPAASAHARLDSSRPERGTVVAREPADVRFTFDENVEGSFGAVRVFDAHAARVDDGRTFHPGGSGKVVATGLKPGLPNGTYTATYRVVSADGHPVSGGIVFSIGSAGAAPVDTVAQLAGKAGAGKVTSTAFAVARALQYGAIAAGLGLLIFFCVVWPRALRGLRDADEARAAEAVGAAATGESSRSAEARAAVVHAFGERATRHLRVAAAVGALSAVLAVLLEGAVGAGTSLWSALTPAIVRETLSTQFGVAWGLAAVLWVLAAGLTALRARSRGAEPTPRLESAKRPPAAALALAPLVLLPALGGHASTQHPAAVMLLANITHVAAVSAWFGGLLALVFVLPAATRAAPAERRGPMLAAALPTFSRVALFAVVLVVLTGSIQSLFELTAVDDLVDTGFGRAILIKIAIVAMVGGFATRNHRRTVPAIVRAASAGEPPGRAGRALRTTVLLEAALLTAVFAATGALSGYPPPTQVAAGPFSLTTTIGPRQLQATVDPARVGANEIHLYLLNPRDGTQFDGTKQLTLTATLPSKDIGPLELQATIAGPGHFVSNGAVLSVPGQWRLTVVDRVSDFDEFQATFTVPVR